MTENPKTKLPDGLLAYLTEPDREAFVHDGYTCVIIRHPDLKHLCGYVGIPKGHPLFGKDMESDECNRLAVHGCITYSDNHLPLTKPNKKPKYWWLGFDTAHGFDVIPELQGGLIPFTEELLKKLGIEWPSKEKLMKIMKENEKHSKYRTIEYVKQELIKLVAQVKEFGK